MPALLVSVAIFLIVIAGILSAHLFGIRMMQVVEANHGMDQTTQAALRRLDAELRSAAAVRVGTGDEWRFQELDSDTLQAGNALEIRPKDSPEQVIRYFHDRREKTLIRTEPGNPKPQTIARHVVNPEVFTVEDHTGTILSNAPTRHIVGVRLSFSEINSTGTEVGRGKHFESYEVNSKVTVNKW
jgi:hypothetical protein